MLPTFPKITSRRDRLNTEMIQRLVNAKAPMLAGIAGHIVHEGLATSIARTSGEIDRTHMQQHSAYVTLSRMKVTDFTPKLESYLDAIAEQFAESRSKQVIATITESTEKTGNVVDGRGQPFSEELLYQTLEKMAHSFSVNGEWQAPSLVVGPDLYAKIMAYDKSRSEKQRKEFDKRLKDLIERKKAEHDSEQAGRVLVG